MANYRVKEKNDGVKELSINKSKQEISLIISRTFFDFIGAPELS